MKIHFWKSSHGNFGDDINEFLWEAFLPQAFDDDADTLFLGVGTILAHDVPKARRRIVMGSGCGYGRLPGDLGDASWRIFCVRGPLTAKAVGGAPDLAVADPAILLPLLPGFVDDRQGGTVFVPHWTTAAGGPWKEVCRRAGITFVDPRDQAPDVIRRIATADLVLAESLHGAIVADAFRVPWIAVVGSRNTPFKWHDWAQSLEINYQPQFIGDLSGPYAFLVEAGRRHVGRAARRQADIYALVSAFVNRTEAPPSTGTRSAGFRDSLRRVLEWSARRTLSDERMIERGVRALSRVSRLRPSLSRPAVLEARRNTLLERIETMKRTAL